jgi:hypothetical protein
VELPALSVLETPRQGELPYLFAYGIPGDVNWRYTRRNSEKLNA